MTQSPSKSRIKDTVVVILGVLPLILCILSLTIPVVPILAGTFLEPKLPPTWQSMGKLPEPATIDAVYRVGASVDYVYVKGDSGKVLFCCLENFKWIEGPLPPDPKRPLFFSHQGEPYTAYYNSKFKSLPATVVDFAEADWSQEWTLEETWIVILSDQSVWIWQRNSLIVTLDLFIVAFVISVAYYLVLARILGVSVIDLVRRGFKDKPKDPATVT